MNSKIETGDIIFTSKKGPISWLLRFLLGPIAYSHVCLAGEEIDGRQSVYTTGLGGGRGLKPAGPRFLPASRFRQLYADEYLSNKTFTVCRYLRDAQAGLTPGQKAKILTFSQSQLGRRFPFRKTGRFFGGVLRGKGIDSIKTTGQSDLYTCYQVVVVAYDKLGIDLNPRAKHGDSSGYDAKEIYLSPYLVDVFSSGHKNQEL